MVQVKNKNEVTNTYNYPNKEMETVILDKKIRDDIRAFCKEKKLERSKLVEEFYKTILIRFRDGSLNSSQGYVTLNILKPPICKQKKKKFLYPS